MERKKGCALTSEAPAREPRRRNSSLMRSLRMRDLQRLVETLVLDNEKTYCEDETHFDTFGPPLPSGNGTSSLKMLANVAFRFLPLNGVVPNNIS